MKKITNIIAGVAAMGGGFLATDANAEVKGDFSQGTISRLQNIKNSKEKGYKNLKGYLNSLENTVVLKVSNDTKIDNTYDINTNPDFQRGGGFEGYKIVLINEDGMNLFDELLKDNPNASKIKQLSGNLIYGEISIDGNISNKSTIIKSEVNQIADILSKDKISNEKLTNALDALTAQILGDNASEKQVDELISDIQNTAPADIYIKFGIFGLLLFGLIAYLMKKGIDGKSMFAVGKYGKIAKLPIQNAETKLYNNHINENLLSDKNIGIIIGNDKYRCLLSSIIYKGSTDFIDNTVKPSGLIYVIKKILSEGSKKEKLEIITLLNDVYLDNKAPMNLEINSKNYKKISNFLTNNKDNIKKEIDNINIAIDNINDDYLYNNIKDKTLVEGIKGMKIMGKNMNYRDNYIDILKNLGTIYIYANLLNYGKYNIDNKAKEVISDDNEFLKIQIGSLLRSVNNIFNITKSGLTDDSSDKWQEDILVKKMKNEDQDLWFYYLISQYENIQANLPIYN